MSNYSRETSLPAYNSFPEDKKRQQDMIYELIKNGADCLLKLSELTGLEQGRVSARVSDLQNEGRVKYDGKIIYKNFTRKKICIIKLPVNGVQKELFI